MKFKPTKGKVIVSISVSLLIIINLLISMNLSGPMCHRGAFGGGEFGIDYWEEWWFYPTNLWDYSRILYMVPQTIYDQLFPIEIHPAPESIKRVGIITITDLPIIES